MYLGSTTLERATARLETVLWKLARRTGDCDFEPSGLVKDSTMVGLAPLLGDTIWVSLDLSSADAVFHVVLHEAAY